MVGRPHADWGEEVVACVVPAATRRTTATRRARWSTRSTRWCLEHIARFKRPKAYVVLAELPKNNTGKVLKTELRRIVATVRGPGSGLRSESRSRTRARRDIKRD